MTKRCDNRGPGGVHNCDRDAVKDDGGPFCDRHGCRLCGWIILADYEDEQLCEACGDKRRAS